MTKSMSKIGSLLLALCLLLSCVTLPVAADEVAAAIILETTNEPPTGVVPMNETLMIRLSNGAEPDSYSWRWGSSATVRGTEAAFRPTLNYADGGAKGVTVTCEVTYDGETITTAPVTLEDYTNHIPHSWFNKDGNNFYKSIKNDVQEASKSEYIFEVDGKSFVLAHEQNVKNSAYFIMALDAYGDIYNGDKDSDTVTDNAKLFYARDGFKANDSGKTMQDMLLGDGNNFQGIGSDNTTTYALPNVFNSYIDNEHSWGFSGSNNSTVSALTSGVTIPSLADYYNYASRVGWKDNIYNTDNSKSVLLRDSYASGTNSSNHPAGQVVTSNGLETGEANGPYLVRPCFWLAKDFFEKNAIELTAAGSGVLAVMKNEIYTNQETLKQTYVNAGKEDDYNRYLNPDYEVKAEIILETTNEPPTGVVPMNETLMIRLSEGAEPTGYSWKWGSSATVRGTEAAFRPTLNYADGEAKGVTVTCEVTYDGGKVTTAPVTLEDYTNHIPHSWNNKDGNNFYKSIKNDVQEASKSEYIFEVDGKSFVLAHEQNVKNSAYFIMALDAYGDIYNGDKDSGTVTDNAKLFYARDGFKANDSGKTMQDMLLGDGNNFQGIGSDNTTTYALPDVFNSYIDNEHSWGFSGSNNSTVSALTSGVTIPSLADYYNYASRVGWKDNIYNADNSKSVLLRDVNASGDSSSNHPAGQVVTSDGLETSGSTGPYLVRPCFWLAKDFFEENVIELSAAGSGVLAVMKNEVYTDQETLKQTYVNAGKEDDYNRYLNPDYEVKAEIILETTNEPPTGVVPMNETLMIRLSEGAEPTDYDWKWTDGKGDFSQTDAEKNGKPTFRPPLDYSTDGKTGVKLQCTVTIEGGQKIVTEPVILEDYTNYIPHNSIHPDGSVPYKKLPNAENSDSDYTFEVGGKSFVLVYEQNVKNSAYFIMAMDAYGDIYSGDWSPKNSDDAKNFYAQIGFKANDSGKTMQDMLLDGGNNFASFGEDHSTTYALPDIFKNYIDMEHSWPFANDHYGTVKAFDAGVTVPSAADYINYQSRVGWKDNLYDVMSEQNVLLRDSILVSGTKYAGNVVTYQGLEYGDRSVQYLVRPCFWLAKDFFEKNAIELTTAGSGVLAVMKNELYTDQETLKQTYVNAGKEDDYNFYLNNKVSLGITVRGTGAAAGTAKLRDTLVATLIGWEGDTDYTYGWQMLDNGIWTDMPEEYVNGGELALTSNLAGKSVRAGVSLGSTDYWSGAITVPGFPASQKPGGKDSAINLTNSENSAAARTFTVDGRGFVLLETFDNDVEAYYVTTTDSYGTANSVTNGTKDTNKSYTAYGQFGDNGARPLADHLLSDGNNYYGFLDGSDTSDKYALPEGIGAHIHKDTVWNRYMDNYWKNRIAATVTDPLQMLSYTDFVTYSDILGWKDNVFDVVGDQYLLRDAVDIVIEGGYDWYTNAVVSDQGQCLQTSGKVSVVRPAFYLDADFFGQVALDDLAGAGSYILALMKEKYYADDLQFLYEDAELEEAGFTRRLTVKSTWTDKNGGSVGSIDTATSLKVNIEFTNLSTVSYPAVLILAVYDQNGGLVSVNAKPDITIPASTDGETAASATAECVIDSLPGNGSGLTAQIMIWDDLDSMTPLVRARTYK